MMDSAVFGSFSQTSFIDLYHGNTRTWHDTCKLYEIYSCPKTKNELNETYSQIITEVDNIESFKRKSNSSYLFGISYDSTSPHGIYHFKNVGDDVSDIRNNIEFTENYKERKKNHEYYVTIEDGVLVFYTSEREHLYIDQYLSISSIALNNYDPVLPDIEYSLYVDKIVWESFGNMEGYGSRNKIKKLIYSQYDKSNS